MSSLVPRNTRSHHDWMAHGGFSQFHEEAGCHTYARRLVRYISDPSTVRIRTMEVFGISPSIEAIRAMRENLVATRTARVEAALNYGIAYERTRARTNEKRRATRGSPSKPVMAVPAPPAPVEIELEEPVPAPVPADAARLLTGIDVVDACADYCGISHGELIGSSREVPFVRARNLAVAILRARNNSYPIIGRFVHREHTTVMHAANRFFEREIADPRMLAAWNAMAPEHTRHCRSLDELNRLLAA
jgi:hypothetical protein